MKYLCIFILLCVNSSAIPQKRLLNLNPKEDDLIRIEIKKRADQLNLPPLFIDGQIIYFNNGVMTLVNASGVFVIDPKQYLPSNTARSLFTPFLNIFNPNKNTNLDQTLNQQNQTGNVNPNTMNIYQYFPDELLKLNFEPGQTVSVNNNILTITNSSGTFMGSIFDGKLRKVSDAQNTYYGFSNINNPMNQSISIVNGIIVIKNSTGSYAGKSYEKLVKID